MANDKFSYFVYPVFFELRTHEQKLQLYTWIKGWEFPVLGEDLHARCRKYFPVTIFSRDYVTFIVLFRWNEICFGSVIPNSP